MTTDLLKSAIKCLTLTAIEKLEALGLDDAQYDIETLIGVANELQDFWSDFATGLEIIAMKEQILKVALKDNKIDTIPQFMR